MENKKLLIVFGIISIFFLFLDYRSISYTDQSSPLIVLSIFALPVIYFLVRDWKSENKLDFISIMFTPLLLILFSGPADSLVILFPISLIYFIILGGIYYWKTSDKSNGSKLLKIILILFIVLIAIAAAIGLFIYWFEHSSITFG